MKLLLSLTLLLHFCLLCPCISSAEQMGIREKPALQKPNMPTMPSSPRELIKSDTATVIGIIDPLRVQLSDHRIIRLSGIEIPDLSANAPGPLSLQGREVLKELLVNQKVNLYQTRDKQEGRISEMEHPMAHITRQKDSIWAQGVLLRMGLARVQTSLSNRQLAKNMLSLEQTARSRRDGLWDDKTYRILKAENITQHQSGFAIIMGRIQRIATLQNRIFLNFGQDRRQSFRAVIGPQARRMFMREDLSPLKWQGQKVRLRGWLHQSSPPKLKLDHPEQIELLTTTARPVEKEIDNALPKPQ